MPPTQNASTSSPIGRSTPRVDGPLKVTGAGRNTPLTFTLLECSTQFPVEATIAKRSHSQARHIVSRENARRGAPSFQRGEHRQDFPLRAWTRLRRHRRRASAAVRRRHYPLLRPVCRARGWADTFETAKAAADAVRVTYTSEPPNVRHRSNSGRRSGGDGHYLWSEDPPAKPAWAMPRACVCEGSRQARSEPMSHPPRRKNPLEPHATTAIWEGSRLTAVRILRKASAISRACWAQMFAFAA